MTLSIQHGGARELWANDGPDDGVAIAWLGQAGFAIRGGGRRIVTDPYLSDSLAQKYRGTKYPHARMMPLPIEPSELVDTDVVFCTHAHTDHMDPGTLPKIAAASPDAVFVVPRAAIETAIERGIPSDRIVAVNAGECFEPIGGVEAVAVAAAHESTKVNELGEHQFLGYVTRIAGVAIYHSGDTVPFFGLPQTVARLAADVALLPVNGRDAQRAANGVPGNMTFDEAVDLCREAGIETMIPHHFGMFDFNTADPDDLAHRIDVLDPPPRCVLPEVDRTLYLTPSPIRTAQSEGGPP